MKSNKLLPEVGSDFPYLNQAPILSAAVDEMENNNKAPRTLVAMSALAAVSMVSQGLVDVVKPNGQKIPVSILALAIAQSGERKSTVEGAFMDVIREFQNSKNIEYEREFSDWSIMSDIWSAERKELLRSIVKARKSGEASEIGEERLISHEKKSQ